MSDRRSFLAGAGGAFLAASPESAQAAAGDKDFIYAGGIVWNSSLSGVLGQLRLEVYLGVKGDGTGIGTVNDPLNAYMNSHLRVQRTVQNGNQYQFEGFIERSNDSALLGQPFGIAAVAHGEGTILNFTLGGNVYPGLGRIINLRGNAAGLAVPR